MRTRYIEEIILEHEFSGAVSFSQYHDTRAYVDLTMLTTAKAILEKAQPPYRIVVYVDGLQRSERPRFAAGLRKLNVSVEKVRGVRKEQSDEFIRLADAVAGLVRDVVEGEETMKNLYEEAVRKGIIHKI